MSFPSRVNGRVIEARLARELGEASVSLLRDVLGRGITIESRCERTRGGWPFGDGLRLGEKFALERRSFAEWQVGADSGVLPAAFPSTRADRNG